MAEKKKFLRAYQIVKNTNQAGKEFKKWNPIGVAFVNKDGSLAVKLDSFPIGGEFQLREPTEKESTDAEAPAAE